MFTIKWIASNGYEHLYRGRDVRYVPVSARSDVPGKTTVEFDVDGLCCTLDSGRVYVMNEAGKTVADYCLGNAEFPHGLAPRQAA